MVHNITSMDYKSLRNYFFTLLLFVGSFSLLKSTSGYVGEKTLATNNNKIQYLKHRINNRVINNQWPENIDIKDSKYLVTYTRNKKLDKYVQKLLKRYRSDYSTIIVLDNNTGNILSASGYDKAEKSLANHLAFSTTHPSASLFKIITSATLLDQGKINNKTTFSYRGRGTTLYRYQLKRKRDRWTRVQTLENAFAHSNNVIFGKAAISKITGPGIYDMANKFGFNKKLMEGMNLSASTFAMPTDQYHLAELATGFNKQTLISPIHAAVLSSIVANNGVFKKPRLIKDIHEVSGKVLWDNPTVGIKVLDSMVSSQLKAMMKLVVTKGTARSISRDLRRKIRKNLNIGGKTGSITGGIPYGKRDWLTLFAMPKEGGLDKGISIAVMNINVKKWYVKSSFLAKKVIEYYFKEIEPMVKEKMSEEAPRPAKIDILTTGI
jgi:penicillin-binding protein A